MMLRHLFKAEARTRDQRIVRFIADSRSTYQLVRHTSGWAEPITSILPIGAEIWIVSEQSLLLPCHEKRPG